MYYLNPQAQNIAPEDPELVDNEPHQFLLQRLNINQSVKHGQQNSMHGAATPCLVEEARSREVSFTSMQERDKKMLQMIIGTITPDGVVNLQAKNIMQSQYAHVDPAAN